MTKYAIFTKYTPDNNNVPPMSEWRPEDIDRHLGFLAQLNRELSPTASSWQARPCPVRTASASSCPTERPLRW